MFEWLGKNDTKLLHKLINNTYCNCIIRISFFLSIGGGLDSNINLKIMSLMVDQHDFVKLKIPLAGRIRILFARITANIVELYRCTSTFNICQFSSRIPVSVRYVMCTVHS